MIYQRILITGANGLLGQQLVQLLSQYPEYDVLATGRQSSSVLRSGSFGYATLDITSYADVQHLFLDFAPTVVVNCAAMTQVDQCEVEKKACWEINVNAVEHLCRASRRVGTRLIQVSTDFVFDGANGPYRETDRPAPINFYGRSKLAAENVIRASSLKRWAIARTVLLYGTGEKLKRQNVVLWALNHLTQGKPIQVVNDQWRTPTYAPDLAHGIERIIRTERTGLYHISGREFLSVYEFIQRVASFFDLDTNLISPADSSTIHPIAPRPPRTGFVIEKAETELDYHPHTIETALADMSQRLDVPDFSL